MRLAPSPLFFLLLATVVSCGDDRLKGFGDEDAEPQQSCTTALDCDQAEVCESGFCACRSVECLGKPTSPGTDDGGGSGGGTGGGTGDSGGGGGGTGTGTGTGGGGGGGSGGGTGGTTTGPQPPYLGGQWNTEYHLDWSDYLGPLGDLGTPLDIVDQLFMGTSEIASLPIAGPIIQEIIDQYVPSWLVDLVHILNNVVHFFEDVRIHGRMVLTHVNGQPTNMTATENWEWGYVRIIDQCPRGESDPNYPACAEFAVPLNLFTADFGSIRAEAKPFTGTIAGGPTTYNATFGGRRVEMEISRFVQFVLDHVVELASNGQYDTFGESLVSLFDCESVAYDMSAFLCNNFNSCGQLHTIEQACLWSVNAGVATLMQKLDEIDADWEVMRFDAQAGIVYDATSRYASKLGLPTAPGTIANGEFEVLMGADLTGTWSGKRP